MEENLHYFTTYCYQVAENVQYRPVTAVSTVYNYGVYMWTAPHF